MNLREIIAAAFSKPSAAQAQPPPPPSADPWNDPSLAPQPQMAAPQQPPPGAGAGMPAGYEDPFKYAQELEQRQRAAATLASPAVPAVEVPLDALLSLLGMGQGPVKR